MADLPNNSRPTRLKAALGRLPWRWGLRTMVLLVAAAAIGISIVNDRRRIAELTPRVERLRAEARELVIDDPSRMAAVQLEPIWSRGVRWDVYLPPGSRYRLALATRHIRADVPATPGWSVPIESGIHRVRYERVWTEVGWEFLLEVDGARRLVVHEPHSWEGSGMSTVGVGNSQQAEPGRPLVLERSFCQGEASPKQVELLKDDVRPWQTGRGEAIWVERTP